MRLSALLLLAIFVPRLMAAGEPVPLSECKNLGITPPTVTEPGLSIFPPSAKLQNSDGVCAVYFVVDVAGNPVRPRVLHCTDSEFEPTVLQTISTTRFAPATDRDGNPVPVLIRLIQRYHSANYVLRSYLLNAIPYVNYYELFTKEPKGPHYDFVIDRKMSKAEYKRQLARPIHAGFLPETGGASVADADGVYPLTRNVTAPRLLSLEDEGYGSYAFLHEGHSACDVLLTVEPNGRSSEPVIRHCDAKDLEEPVRKTLERSRFTPGFVAGKSVPMRGLLRISYGDVE